MTTEQDNKPEQNRTRIISALLASLNSSHPDRYCSFDFELDRIAKRVLLDRDRDVGKEPYSWTTK